jgi:hypothetical protein
MKTIIFSISFFCAVLNLDAQQSNKTFIGAKQQLQYNIYVNGASLKYFIRFDSLSAQYASLTWSDLRERSGSYIMRSASLDSSVNGYWNPPQADAAIEIDNSQTVLMLSKLNYTRLKQQKKMVYDDKVFLLTESPAASSYTLTGNHIPCLYAEAEDKSVKLWVYDNPSMPLMLKMQGNPYAVDFELTGTE